MFESLLGFLALTPNKGENVIYLNNVSIENLPFFGGRYSNFIFYFDPCVSSQRFLKEGKRHNIFVVEQGGMASIL